MINLLEIDLKPLEDALSKKFGIQISLERKISTRRDGDERMSICSQDLKQNTGILEQVYEYLHITDFGNEYNNERLWMGLNLSFSYVHGGSNGTGIGNCWYYFDTKKWTIELN